ADHLARSGTAETTQANSGRLIHRIHWAGNRETYPAPSMAQRASRGHLEEWRVLKRFHADTRARQVLLEFVHSRNQTASRTSHNCKSASVHPAQRLARRTNPPIASRLPLGEQ